MIDPSTSRAIGFWRLVSFREDVDGELVDYFGPEPRGFISYHPSGHMSALLARRDRPRFRGEWADIPAVEKASALDGLVAYGGRFTDFGDRLVHHVETCWIPNWEGRDLVRIPDYVGQDRMVLRTVPDPSGRLRPQTVEWHRA